MSDSLSPSFLMSDVSESLRSLTKIEHPWAICSGRSPKMSELLRLLTKNEQMSEALVCFFEQIAHSLIFSQKTSDLLRKSLSEFPAL